jgi:hypothetical protein
VPVPLGKKAAVALRRARALQLKVAGYTLDQIAAELEYGGATLKARRANVHTDITRALESTLDHSAAEYRKLHLARLEAAAAVAYQVMTSRHLLVQAGKVVRLYSTDDIEAAHGTVPAEGDEPPAAATPAEFAEAFGAPVYDDAPQVRAAEALSRILAREAALLGLDAPTRVENEGALTVTVVGVDPAELT